MRTIRDAKFVPQWVDLTQEHPAPLFGHITRQYLNLSYGRHPLQAVDLYLPEEGNPPFPTLILVHGGGFSRCDKRDLSVYPGFYALREGFALALSITASCRSTAFPAKSMMSKRPSAF